MKQIIRICVLVTTFVTLYIASVVNTSFTTEIEEAEKIVYINHELSEWDIFVLALIDVECGGNPSAVSHKDAVGPFQITQIYIDEVNRLYNTSYVLNDAFDLNKSYDIFKLMNDHYNPNKDIDIAIKLHNPGAGDWYSKRIKSRMDKIRFNESMRNIIIN